MSRRPRIGLTLELTDPIIAKVDAARARGDRGRRRHRRRDPALGRPGQLAGRLRLRRRRRADGRAGRLARRLRSDGTPAHAPGPDGLRRHGARSGARVPARRQARARDLPRQPGAQRRRRRHADPGRAVDGHEARAHGRMGARGRRPAELLARDRGARGHTARGLAGRRPARRQLLPPPGGRSPGRRAADERRGARRHDRGDRVDERRLRGRPAVAQRVPHARRRALRPPAAGARRRARAKTAEGRAAARAAAPPAPRARTTPPAASASRRT